MPSQCYQNAGCASYDIGDADNPDVVAVYNFADEEFDQQATSLVLDWDISDALSVRYLGDYRWFQYWFNRDNDFSNGTYVRPRRYCDPGCRAVLPRVKSVLECRGALDCDLWFLLL